MCVTKATMVQRCRGMDLSEMCIEGLDNAISRRNLSCWIGEIRTEEWIPWQISSLFKENAGELMGLFDGCMCVIELIGISFL